MPTCTNFSPLKLTMHTLCRQCHGMAVWVSCPIHCQGNAFWRCCALDCWLAVSAMSMSC